MVRLHSTGQMTASLPPSPAADDFCCPMLRVLATCHMVMCVVARTAQIGAAAYLLSLELTILELCWLLKIQLSC